MPVDIFRDTWLRYTAFASDFGEALRPFLGKGMYLGSYGIVAAYATADTMDRGYKAYWNIRPLPLPSTSSSSSSPRRTLHPTRPRAGSAYLRTPAASVATISAIHPHSPVPATKHFHPVTATVIDSLLWHGAASLLLPYIVINRTVWATNKAMAAVMKLSLPSAPPAATAAAALHRHRGAVTVAATQLHPHPHPHDHLLPTLSGLAMIPLVVPHIDHFVTEVMNATIRPHLNLVASVGAAGEEKHT